MYEAHIFIYKRYSIQLKLIVNSYYQYGYKLCPYRKEFMIHKIGYCVLYLG